MDFRPKIYKKTRAIDQTQRTAHLFQKIIVKRYKVSEVQIMRMRTDNTIHYPDPFQRLNYDFVPL